MKNIFNYIVPIYTVGGCHMYYGLLNNGNWFFTSDSYDWYGYELTEDPSEYMWEDDFETERIKGKVIRDFDGDEYSEFYTMMLSWLVDNGYTKFQNY